MKILINALSGNGDALMFSPSLRLLKEKIPAAEIDMLVMFKSVKEMYEHNPFLNKIYHINFLKQSKLKSIQEILSLRKNNYDVSINVYPSNRTEYNVVNYFLGAKKRLGHNYTHTDLLRLEILNNVTSNEIPDRHNVLQNFDLVKSLTEMNEKEVKGLEIFLSEEDKKKSEEWIKENDLQNKLLVGFHAGSAVLKNHIHKRWDKEKFASLGNLLREKYDAKILLFGNEFDLNLEIDEMLRGQGILASTSNYMDSMARMRFCNLFVSNDSAFLHSSAAFKIPTVGIFGYTNAQELFPWGTKHLIVRIELDCSPCFYNSPKPVECLWTGKDEFKCMKMIMVEDVFEACKILLNEN
ncbi:MAG: glycosyltransferase family 9 protein [Ignavibacteria bacterium]|nr:glycosyltransferase family 9 protein [Ignavibacteria bacterium]